MSVAKRLHEGEPVDPIFAACPQLKTLPAGSQRTTGAKHDAVGCPKHGLFFELLDAHMPDGHGVEAGQCQNQSSIAARCGGGGGERASERRFDDWWQEATPHDGPEHPAELFLPFDSMRPQSPAAAMPLPSGGMGHLVKECRQKCVRIEIVVDRDAMHATAPLWRAVIAELRPARSHDVDIHVLSAEHVFDVA